MNSVREKKKRAEMNKGFFLPNLSLNSPDIATPTIQPINAAETNQPSWNAESVNCFCRNGSTPEITAISKPNRNPPSDATSVMVRMDDCLF